ncbi:GNAT family N-acetyltransferase [Pseudomonas rhodesiae]|jgi:predicted GNAT family N-acyltransferase|uniref:GNAT family N-acetyltransferase n=1 Tax=Pseudomonas quebecensis TaxID=2995174 RepID=A0ABY6QCD5_9PSED|nr:MULTISPECIES: GNAT family N-acetyltransferase [Pseudomonas]MCX4066538.1 GNAT family N-acetyltransferase [Pseudomonas quebecensis]UZW16965.1 GNAT family N-acetyltransferase [Pseudomonas quebecensis]UZW25620.1 GNAT family N-acetyltransferase [Pseudomonas quebecensis]UZW30683.1 GNAT family N-acetyltransferase [Pseudomonas quebecensis]WLH42556.1 GNAT family N-acetyltransferase [Pseudomonas sp. FP2254]
MGFTLKPIISSGAPESARTLFWEVFFASRGRGIDLVTHFPWLADDENVSCIEFINPEEQNETLAALVVRYLDIGSGNSIGLIGLVCVAEQWRGKGLASRLMSRAIEFAERENLGALVLWTQKPEVYVSQGFVIDQEDRFGSVECVIEHSVKVDYATNDWPDSTRLLTRGLPPFAIRGQVISNENARIIVLASNSGLTVAEWEGDSRDVVDLMMASMPARWSLNSAQDDPLLAELEKSGVALNLQSAAVRMVKYLSGRTAVELPNIKFLDRV